MIERLLAAALLLHAASAAGLRAKFHSNAVLAANDGGATATTVPSLDLSYSPSAPPPHGSLQLFSARLDGTLTAPAAGSYEFRVRTNGAVRFFVDDHIIVDSSCDVPSSLARPRGFGKVVCHEWAAPANHTTVVFYGRDFVTHHIERGLHIRVEWLHYAGGPATLQLQWRPGTPSVADSGGDGGAPFAPIAPSALSTVVNAAELWRQSLQANMRCETLLVLLVLLVVPVLLVLLVMLVLFPLHLLPPLPLTPAGSRGWNTWMRESASRHVHLPSAFGFEITLWDAATNTTFAYGIVDKCKGADADSCKIKPFYHR